MDVIRDFGKATFSSLGIRNYRLYFIGQAISLSGTWMQTVALGWLALTLSGSGAKLGLVIALQFLPLMLLGPWGGVMVDRFDKRMLLYWTQVVAGIVSLIVGLLVLSGSVEFWMLYPIALAIGTIRVFDNPGRQSFVTEMVPPEYTKNAVSLNSTVNNLARAVGPAIGGVLIAGVGIAFCFIVNAFTYVALAIALKMMRESELHLAEKKKRTGGELFEGFRYVRDNPVIRDTLILVAIIGTFAFEFQVSLPIIAKMVFNADAEAYAALLGAMGVGSVIGGLFAAGRQHMYPSQLAFWGVLFGLSMIATAFMPTLELAIFGMFVVGFFSINTMSLANTMIQLEAIPQMRGRVMGLWSTAMIGSTPIGGPIVGYVAQYAGGRWGLAIGGIATIIAIVPALSALVRRRVFDRREEEEILVAHEEKSAKLH